MNKRQKQILSMLVNETDFITIADISEEESVSQRTVHNDIKKIDEILKEHNISLIKKQNVGIKIDAPISIKRTLLNYADETTESIDLYSTKIRRMKILAQLLYAQEATSLNKLSEEYLVSKTSIVSDLDLIEKEIHQFNLQLLKNHTGTRVVGKEADIRKCLSKLSSYFLKLDFEEAEFERKKTRLDLSTYYRLSHLFEAEYLETVEEIIYGAEQFLGYEINEISYVNLVTHLLILIKRVNNSVEQEEEIFKIDESDKAMLAAQYIATELKSRFGLNFIEREVKYIYQYILCSGIQNDSVLYHIDVDKECLNLVEDLIKFVSDAIYWNLEDDQALKLNLISHFIPLLHRIQYKVSIDNPLLSEIKSQYSAMFSIVSLAVSMLNHEEVNHISNDEIGFLTIHFQAAVERTMTQKHIVIVCPEGIGFSQLIAHRIERFISSVFIEDTVSLRQFKDKDLEGIDFIVSTTPIESCPLPVVLVSSFISESDIQYINNFLVESSFCPSHVLFENLPKAIDDDLIFVNLETASKEETLKCLCNQMYKKGYVTQKYKETVLAREKIVSTELGNGIAIPHGNEKEIMVPKIVIATLKEEILWGKDNVKIVFFDSNEYE